MRIYKQLGFRSSHFRKLLFFFLSCVCVKTDVITDSCKYKPSVRNYYNCKYFLLSRLYLFYSLICYSKAKHTVLIHDFRQTIYPLILE